MTLNESCKNRLMNWKFTQAQGHLDQRATGGERAAVVALSATFGNVGWFEGSMGAIVAAAVARLLDGWPDDEEDNE